MAKNKKKRTYTVIGEVTISIYTEVEATSEEEARELAEGRSMSELGVNACCEEPDEAWVADELDGEPTILEVNEA